ncbi:MAG: flagellar filament capping protein FliD [Myxococcota bacterium]
MEATFRAGGLMSGLDTNEIIDQLTNLQRRPIELVTAKKQAFQVQLSIVGAISSRLSSLQGAFDSFTDQGSLVMEPTSTANGYSATTTSEALEGTYDIKVTNLATAAKARSTAFAGPSAPVSGGSLDLNIDGTSYPLTIADGTSLVDVAAQINDLGAPVTASLVNDGTSTYLTLTNKNTGYEIGQDPSTALSITETPTDPLASMLGLSIVAPAENATVEIDGLTVTRRSNSVTDALPGTTLSLLAETTSTETLAVKRSDSATQANLQKLVDAYNSVMTKINGELDINANLDRNKSLAGDSSIKRLQRQLQALVTTEVTGLTGDNTLAEIGVETQRDGSLSIDAAKLSKALARDPNIIDNLVSGTGGLAAKVETLVERATDTFDGTLSLKTKSLNASIRTLDDTITNMQFRVDTFRETLIRRFSAMEEAISKAKSTGSYLSNVKLPGFSKGSN